MPPNWQQIGFVDRLSSAPPTLGLWVKTERAQVAGGRLVRTYLVRREAAQVAGSGIEPEFSTSVALTCVPDPVRTWRM